MNRTYGNIGGILLLAACMLAAPQARAAGERTYDTREAAVADLASAARKNDAAGLRAILGPDAGSLIESGDAVEDAADRAAFAAAYAERNSLVPAEGRADRYFLDVGANGWRFPIPLVRESASGRWRFDNKAGAEALLDRRIGHNELAAIQVCLAYADAQWEYWRLNPDKTPVRHFAAALASRPGKRDGLYWDATAEDERSPMGALVAAAESGGYAAPSREERTGEKTPYYGYRYRVLTGQGGHAAGGARDYRENGEMVNGFALLAYPETYGVSGVMTFMVNQEGVVYEKNLGRDTTAEAAKIAVFDPDSSWRAVEVTDTARR
ncbi:conserved exported hypothetical protein [uncultured delta proteobacterium]|uniref:DUF2950 domain-containing protein n=1 Tax=uncultured delta proteobacterium TaxID=34034 RepID=A0A212K340_9DELT|nr:conserved exported hypothetical protein [uncultured delta proteobacterium]